MEVPPIINPENAAKVQLIPAVVQNQQAINKQIEEKKEEPKAAEVMLVPQVQIKPLHIEANEPNSAPHEEVKKENPKVVENILIPQVQENQPFIAAIELKEPPHEEEKKEEKKAADNNTVPQQQINHPPTVIPELILPHLEEEKKEASNEEVVQPVLQPQNDQQCIILNEHNLPLHVEENKSQEQVMTPNIFPRPGSIDQTSELIISPREEIKKCEEEALPEGFQEISDFKEEQQDPTKLLISKEQFLFNSKLEREIISFYFLCKIPPEHYTTNPLELLNCRCCPKAIYCPSCLEGIAKNIPKCSQCSEKFDPSGPYAKTPDIIKKIEDFVQFQCKFCPWNGPLNTFKFVHIDQCPNMEIQCPNTKDSKHPKIKRNELAEHLKVCDKRAIQCKYCKEKTLLEEKEYHKICCSEWPQQCERCSEVFPKRFIPIHTITNCQSKSYPTGGMELMLCQNQRMIFENVRQKQFNIKLPDGPRKKSLKNAKSTFDSIDCYLSTTYIDIVSYGKESKIVICLAKDERDLYVTETPEANKNRVVFNITEDWELNTGDSIFVQVLDNVLNVKCSNGINMEAPLDKLTYYSKGRIYCKKADLSIWTI